MHGTSCGLRTGLVPQAECTAAITLRCYEELNDYLPTQLRKVPFAVPIGAGYRVADVITELRIPSAQIDLVLRNGQSVDFGAALVAGDYLSLYPVFERFDITPLVKLEHSPLRRTRFIATAELSELAKLLQRLGFDTVYDVQLSRDQIAQTAENERRIVVSSERSVFQSRKISRGLLVSTGAVDHQLAEILQHLQLEMSVSKQS